VTSWGYIRSMIIIRISDVQDRWQSKLVGTGDCGYFVELLTRFRDGRGRRISADPPRDICGGAAASGTSCQHLNLNKESFATTATSTSTVSLHPRPHHRDICNFSFNFAILRRLLLPCKDNRRLPPGHDNNNNNNDPVEQGHHHHNVYLLLAAGRAFRIRCVAISPGARWRRQSADRRGLGRDI